MRWTTLLAVMCSVIALAQVPDPRGWTAGGQPAKNSAAIISGPEEFPEIEVPRALASQIRGPTVVFYFSPTCPHCQHVAREVEALHKRLSAGGTAFVGVASGSSSESDLASFKQTYGTTFNVVRDTEREINAALGLRSTPSALFVEPVKRGTVRVRDLWYPYRPGYDSLIEGRVAGNPFAAVMPASGPVGERYMGHAACGTCHAQEYDSWRLSHHSIAWNTLERQKESTNPECTGCHVTGAGAPGGWDGDAHSKLVDVGCEACHGPGGPHDGVVTEPQSTCASCHDAKHSISFSYAKGLPLIDHYRIVGLSEADANARYQALYRGEVPRELLAFPAGKNVGSAACQSCHVAQHDWWATSPHARAMRSLRKEGHDDPACVKCHATANRSGPVEAKLDNYQILDGVGCESCHGPGEAHVAAGGGTDNIEGLGEDCPVCVIEAVCTSCHTKTWDPDWDLDTRLKAIDH